MFWGFMLESTHMEVTGGMQNKNIALETMQLKDKYWGVSCLGTGLRFGFFLEILQFRIEGRSLMGISS